MSASLFFELLIILNKTSSPVNLKFTRFNCSLWLGTVYMHFKVTCAERRRKKACFLKKWNQPLNMDCGKYRDMGQLMAPIWNGKRNVHYHCTNKLIQRRCLAHRCNSLPTSGDFWCLLMISLQIVWTQIRPDILIWIQTIWHSDSIPEIIF